MPDAIHSRLPAVLGPGGSTSTGAASSPFADRLAPRADVTPSRPPPVSGSRIIQAAVAGAKNGGLGDGSQAPPATSAEEASIDATIREGFAMSIVFSIANLPRLELD